MHGLMNRAFQTFLEVNYGEAVWAEVRSQANLPFDDFESMLTYDLVHSMASFQAATTVLHRSPNSVLEDLGTFIVTHPPFDPVRRLLRFGGATFEEFVVSLEEVGDRSRLVMPDLPMPDISVCKEADNRYRIGAKWVAPGIAPILLGTLRAMADDYGTLAFLNLDGISGDEEYLRVVLHDTAHAEGRSFELGRALA